MGVDANARLFYGFLEPEQDAWSGMIDPDGDEYEKYGELGQKLGVGYSALGYSNLHCISAAGFGTSHRWPETVDPEQMVINPEWEPNLRQYAKELNIDLGDAKPAWHLVAYFD